MIGAPAARRFQTAVVEDDAAAPTTPVRVQHVTKSPPHITDHCYASMGDHDYARPSHAPQLSETDSDIIEIGGAGGGGDHDYTTPRTPPKATPSQAPAVKQKVFNKKSSQALARPTLPSKPVKWKPRDNIAKFGIIYKFLTDGVDAEDIMYLKKSYEMVNI